MSERIVVASIDTALYHAKLTEPVTLRERRQFWVLGVLGIIWSVVTPIFWTALFILNVIAAALPRGGSPFPAWINWVGAVATLIAAVVASGPIRVKSGGFEGEADK